MRSSILALMAATLVLSACSSSRTDAPTPTPLQASVVGDLKNSNDIWNNHRPYAWETASSLPSSASDTPGSSIAASSTAATDPSSSRANAPRDDRSWLELVGMSPQWGPDGHEFAGTHPTDEVWSMAGNGSSSSWFSTTLDGSTTSTSHDEYRVTLGDGSARTASANSDGNGTLNLPSGQRVDGRTSSSSTAGGNGQTLRLPSGRVVDGVSNSTTVSGSGSTQTGNGQTVSLRYTGSAGCHQPDPRDVTSGSGILLPGLIKGNCPVAAAILRVPERADGIFGSMDF